MIILVYRVIGQSVGQLAAGRVLALLKINFYWMRDDFKMQICYEGPMGRGGQGRDREVGFLTGGTEVGC